MSTDTNTPRSEPTFTLALRRNPGVPGNWRLRFEVSGGAFILRTVRGGVKIDGPPLAGGAVDVGGEDVLDSMRLRLVDYSGRRASIFRISQHRSTAPGRWAPLRPEGADDNGTIRLIPPGADDNGDAATSKYPDPSTNPDAFAAPPARIVKHLRRELARTRARADALADEVARLELRLVNANEQA